MAGGAIAITVIIVSVIVILFLFPSIIESATVQTIIVPVLTNPLTWYLGGIMIAVLFGIMICMETIALIDQIDE